MKHYINIAALWFIANEMGLGRMNPWIGLFVLMVLVYQTVKEIYQIERKR